MFRSSKDVTYRVLKDDECDADVEQLGCDFCSEGGWTSETEVEIHKGVWHTEQIFELINKDKNYCRMCIKDCKTIDNLIKHIKTDHLLSSNNASRVQRDIFICDYCGQIFFNKLLLTVHIAHIHLKNNINKNLTRISCPRCSKNVRMETIWFHFQGHSLQSIATCPICLAKCLNKKHLISHMKVHAKLLKCDMCLYETKREELYDTHIQTKHKKKNLKNIAKVDVKPYFLPHTDQTWKYLRFTGIKGLELTNGVRICVLCKEICTNTNEMTNHILVDHNLKEEPVKNEYTCSCGEVFTNKVLLKHHTFKMQGDHKIVN